MKSLCLIVLRWVPVVLCVVLWVSPAWAQEGGGDGRPPETQPGPVVPADGGGEPAAVTAEQDTDEPLVTAEGDISTQNQTISGDLFVVGGECVGIDCTGSESFNFVTIRLKENNNRIYFEDTSSASGFPSNDWQLVANDSGSGGLNHFSIHDVDHNKTPFTVEANAPTAALYVKADGSNGAVGITGAPAGGINLQVADGWTPYLRLQLTSTQGWSPYAWDLFANESNFIIKDTTGGSTYPFTIYPGAPTNSLFVGGANRGNRPGYIGLGTSSPNAALHIAQPSTGWREPQILVEGNSSATEVSRTMLDMVNNGPVEVHYRDRSTNAAWSWRYDDTGVSAVYSNTTTLTGQEAFKLAPNGNLVISGALVESSDAARKANFAAVDTVEVLERVAELPIQSWNFAHDDPAVRHVGPTAQDFHAAFGLGADEQHIAPLDANGVSLAAIQELYRQVQAQNARIELLEKQNTRLQAQLARLQ